MAEEVLRLGIDPGQAVRGSKRFQGAAAASSASANSLAKAVGVAGAAFAAFGAARQVGAAVDGLIEFDSAMNQSLAIMGDVDESMRNQMANSARQMSEDLNFAAEEGAESFFFLASAGLDAEQSIAALPAVAEFARAGMFDLATATDLSTDAQSALGLASDDAQENLEGLTRVTDVLVGANTLANASVEQFANALTNRAAAALRNANREVEEGVAVLAAYADQGLKGRRAGEMLSRMMRFLAQGAADSREEFQNLGLVDAEGNLVSLAETVRIITGELEGLGDTQRTVRLEQLGFAAEAQEAILPLLGMSDAIRENEDSLLSMGGMAGEVSDKQMESLKNRIGQIQQEFRNWRTVMIGETVPAIEAVIENMDVVEDSAKSLAVAAGATGVAGAFVAASRAAQGYTATLAILIARHGGAKTAAATLGTVLGAINWPVVAAAAFAGVVFDTKRRMREAAEEAEDMQESLDLATDSISAMGEEALKVQISQFTLGIQQAEQELAEMQERLEEAEKSEGQFGAQSAQVRVEIERQQQKIQRLEEMLVAAAEGYTSLGDAADDAGDDTGDSGGEIEGTVAVLQELESGLDRARNMALALGNRFDAGDEMASAYRSAIEAMIDEGVDPASDAVQDLVARLEELERLRDIEVRISLATAGDMPTLEGQSGMFTMELQGLDEVTEQFEGVNEAAIKTADALGITVEEADDLVGGVVSLADGLGLLEGETGSAIRSMSDAVSGIDSFQNASNSLGKIAGAAGVAGAVIGLGRAILGSGDAAREAQREFEKAMKSLREFGQASSQLEQDMDEIVSRTAEAIERATETMGFEDVDLSGVESMEDLQAFVDQMNEMAARFGGIDSASEEFQQALAAAEEAMRRAREEQERREQQLRESIAVRRLEAQGMDEAAAAMQRRLEKEQEIAGAREQGFSEETIATLKHVQALEDAATARREEQRAMEEEMQRRKQQRRFGLELQEREAAVSGDDRGALEARLQMQAEQELFEAGKLVEAGVITSEQFRRLAEVLEAEANQALEEHTRQIERQAEALARANASFEQNIALEELRLQGKDREAEILQRQIRFEKELQSAREAGIDEELIERRKEQQERILDEMRRGDGGRGREEAEESARRGRRATSTATTSQAQRISSTQAARISDLLMTNNVWARETAINTRSLRGGRDIPLGQVGARAPSSGTVVNVTLRGDINADNIQDVDRFMRRLGRTVNEALGRETEREERMSGSGRVR